MRLVDLVGRVARREKLADERADTALGNVVAVVGRCELRFEEDLVSSEPSVVVVAAAPWFSSSSP